ncbi:MAG TPA: peptidyl-prolyl cis-trans isomerase [Candidatus Angelobacter sp.]|nr:peptidyl-prolyl cis-trans isomerase [Candidatus Angelobacter sp.]
MMQSPARQPVAATSETQAAKAATTGVAVSPSEAVITVPGVCDSRSRNSDPCVTVITREQFENLLSGLSEAGQPLRRDQTKALAEAYSGFLAYAAAARKSGIEDSPQFREFVKYQNLRVLAGLYKHILEEKYKSPAQEDIADYYRQHTKDFEEVSLRRLMIPKNNPGAKDKEEYKKQALQLAHDMHERAAKGEDFDDLEKEAYKTLGLTIAPPGSQIGKRRRATLVPEEAEEVFSLKPGEASQLETENSSYVIYKVDSKRTIPLDQVKDEIARLLSKERMDNALKAVKENMHPELNPKYFSEPTQPPSGNAPDFHTASPPANLL